MRDDPGERAECPGALLRRCGGLKRSQGHGPLTFRRALHPEPSARSFDQVSHLADPVLGQRTGVRSVGLVQPPCLWAVRS